MKTILLLTVCTGSACSEAEFPQEWGGTMLDSAGMRVVHNPADGLWGEGEAWTVTETLRIGEDHVDPNYLFGEIAGVAVAPSGSIFVLDRLAADVRIFSDIGEHIRTVGGRGQGPGELSGNASGIFRFDDERMVVPDLGNQRINWFDFDGNVTGSVLSSLQTGFPVRWGSDGARRVVVQRRAMGFNRDEELAAGDPLSLIDEDGAERTLLMLPLAKTVRMEGARPRFTYFETEPSWHMGPTGTLRSGMTQKYRIEVRTDGVLHTLITKEMEQQAVTEEDRSAFAELMRAALSRSGVPGERATVLVQDLEFGPTFPAFNQIMEGPFGTTLVQGVQDVREMESLDLSEELSRRLGAPDWDVFDPTGRYLGALTFPDRFTPITWVGWSVLGRWLDDLDRHHLVRLEISH